MWVGLFEPIKKRVDLYLTCLKMGFGRVVTRMLSFFEPVQLYAWHGYQTLLQFYIVNP